MDRRYGVWRIVDGQTNVDLEAKFDHLRNKGFRSSAGPQNVLNASHYGYRTRRCSELKGSKKFSSLMKHGACFKRQQL